ncbi:MAG: apolipoprotein N-acyltransferase [Elusimicrobiota bacterium]
MRPRTWVTAASSGLILVFAFPPFGYWPLAWVAFVPLFLALDDAPDAKAASNLGAVAGLAFYVPALHWIVKVFGPMGGAFWCVFALWIGLHAALSWWTARRWAASHPGLWLAAVGIGWVGLEYFRSEIWKLQCSWLALGYTQVAFPPLLRSVSLIGVYGLSGLIVAANASLALAVRGRRRPAAALFAGVMALAAWGASWPRSDQGRPIVAAAVQDEAYDIPKMAKLSLSPAARRADLLVWPEYGFTVQPGMEESMRGLLGRQLRGSKAVAVLGAAIFPDDLRKGWEQNFAWVLGPDGAFLGRYDKHHPIPFVEPRLKPNRDPRPVTTPLGVVGVQICYDLDFEDGPRRVQRLGAEILAVPDIDPFEWGAFQHRQHSAMSPARAVETGLWIVRAASSGLSQIVAPDGTVREELAPLTSGVVVGTARMTAGGTVYTRFGWLLPKLCLLLTAGFLLWLGAEFYRTRNVKSRIS